MNVTREALLEIIDNAGVSVDVKSIKSDLSFKEVGIDSLEVMNVYLAIEQTFNIKIEDDEIDKLNSVDNIISYLAQL